MPTDFKYDAFLSYASEDLPIVQPLAERLKKDGLNIWFDQWSIKPGDSIPLQIQHGLEQSRTLLMCMSPAYFNSRWTTLEHHTLLFRDPTNEKRRFIPLLIKDCAPPDTIAQFAHIDCREVRDETYLKILTACRGSIDARANLTAPSKQDDQSRLVLEGHVSDVGAVAISPDGKAIVSGGASSRLFLWDLADGRRIGELGEQEEDVYSIAFTPDARTLVSASFFHMRVWDLATRKCQATIVTRACAKWGVAVTPDGLLAVSVADRKDVGIWDIQSGKLHATLRGHRAAITAVSLAPDGKTVASASDDGTVRIWNVYNRRCRAKLNVRNCRVASAVIAPDGRTLVSGSVDGTVKIWDLDSGLYMSTFEGHTGAVRGVAVTSNSQSVVSVSSDGTAKVWDLRSGRCCATLVGHTGLIHDVAITPDGKTIVTASRDRTIRIWDFPRFDTAAATPSTARYTNAKVVLVGESGAGKTGLALRLTEDDWRETGSTHGMSVRRLDLPQSSDSDTEREVWLWDFAGQPDYRLIHQLYMDETALALMVIDPQRDNPFEPLGHWERALSKAVEHDPIRLLVAARCDRGGLTISQAQVDQYLKDHCYSNYLTTAAKTGDGCSQLKDLIAHSIPWDRLPWTSTTKLFKSLKDAIVRIKSQDMVFIRVPELCQRLQLELQDGPIAEDNLRAVIGLLAGQGIIQKLDFGDFVLLQPHQINNYASAIVRSARENSEEIGVVSERAVLDPERADPKTAIDFKDMERLGREDEKVLLRAMLQTLIDRSLCIRIDTDHGPQLVFPSYFKLDRPTSPDHPDVVVTYSFAGTLDEIYSTLVVRLHYTSDFEMKKLWRYAADFETSGGKQVGILLNKTKDDAAEIKVFFSENVPIDTKVSFIKYLHEHLSRHAQDVTRVRSYICANCDTPLENLQAIQKRLSWGKTDIICGMCEERVTLIDLIEEKFGSDEFLQKVRDMDAQAQINLDNESLELILVGQAFSVAGEAGQIFRTTSNSDWGIDGEIEFKNNKGQASGKRVYLQLKSGDSYLRRRRKDEAEVFQIKNPRHAEYWQSHEYPVMLVIRTSDGIIRWMNVTEYLKKHGPNTKQIIFKGQPFTAPNVAALRNKLVQ